jgi:cytochrome b561
MKSTSTHYGRVAQALHWLSALFIIFLLPLGFLMQTVDEGAKLMLYRTHVILGISVLLLTIARLVWHWFDESPKPPAGIKGNHLLLYQGIHWLLYIGMLVLTISGISLNVMSGLGEILSGAAPGPIPVDLSEFPPSVVHGITSRVFIALFVVHVAGVISYQATEGDVLKRIGIGGWGATRQSE